MPGISSVTVYCGSSNDVDPKYLDLARRLGNAIATRGWRLVYGGGSVGLMGQVSTAAREAGGSVLGIMPKFLLSVEGTDERIPHRYVDTMHERKQILFDEAQAFIVLPGGIGTLEEAVETLSWAKLALHRKPTAFLAEDGYWAPFFHLIEHMIDGGFVPADFRRLMADSRTPEEALDDLVQRAIVLE
jgi:uncharacterized protein (TIGR00730 family)